MSPPSTATPKPPADWDPAQYRRYLAERNAPFFDLLALVQPKAAARVLDLGCGTGELTALAHERLGAKETLGLDSSPAMLEQAQPRATAALRFASGRIEDFVPDEPFDLVLSNAALQWVPDHERLLARLTGFLARGGQLAVQVPSNEDHAAHRIAAALAQEPPFAEALSGFVQRLTTLAPRRYAEILPTLGFVAQQVRLQVYGHPLESANDVVEWLMGTLLVPYRQRLPGALYDTFLARYRERVLAELGPARPYFFTFARILLWARLPS